MKNLYQDVKNWLGEASQTVAREAEILTRKGKLKLELYDLNRRLERSFADLGGILYELIFVKRVRNAVRNQKVKDIVETIKNLEGQRGDRLKELSSIDNAMGRKLKK
ncbi:MAG: hypothetical protein ABIL05_01400 [candidate division WOR-3 bacterium]